MERCKPQLVNSSLTLVMFKRSLNNVLAQECIRDVCMLVRYINLHSHFILHKRMNKKTEMVQKPLQLSETFRAKLSVIPGTVYTFQRKCKKTLVRHQLTQILSVNIYNLPYLPPVPTLIYGVDKNYKSCICVTQMYLFHQMTGKFTTSSTTTE